MTRINYNQFSDETLLSMVQDYFREYKKWPSFFGWRKSSRQPSTKVLVERFGSWKELLVRARGKLPELEVNPRVNYIDASDKKHPDKRVKKPYRLDMAIRYKTEVGGVAMG